MMCNLHVKFEPNPLSRLGGVVLTRNVDIRTDRRTDRQTDGRTDRVIPIYPPKLCLPGGIIRHKAAGLTIQQLIGSRQEAASCRDA